MHYDAFRMTDCRCLTEQLLSFGEERNTDRPITDWVFEHGTRPSRRMKTDYVLAVGAFQNLYSCVDLVCYFRYINDKSVTPV